jgi:hypothetical protein
MKQFALRLLKVKVESNTKHGDHANNFFSTSCCGEDDSGTRNLVQRQTKNIPTDCLKPYYWEEKDEDKAKFEGEAFQCDV